MHQKLEFPNSQIFHRLFLYFPSNTTNTKLLQKLQAPTKLSCFFPFFFFFFFLFFRGQFVSLPKDGSEEPVPATAPPHDSLPRAIIPLKIAKTILYRPAMKGICQVEGAFQKKDPLSTYTTCLYPHYFSRSRRLLSYFHPAPRTGP